MPILTDILARGKYVLASPSGAPGSVIDDGGVMISGGTILEVGGFESLKKKYPRAAVKGSGKQLLMPGLVDGHTHGSGLSSIQCGKLFDYLENLLLDWAYLPPLDPDLRVALSAAKHIRSGCTTMHLNYWGEEPNLLENALKCVEGARRAGIRLAYSPGGRNANRLALNEIEFVKTLPEDVRRAVSPLVDYDKGVFVEQYLALFDELHGRLNGPDTRIILGPSWTQGCTDDFLLAVKEKADRLGKVPIHLHTLQTPVQKAYGLKKYGKSLLARLDDLGLVGENLVLGHAVFVNEADISLLAEKGASVTHHPSCNLAVRNGIAPVYSLVKAGVNVALGIDDKALNDDEDAIQELRLIHRLHRVPGFDLSRTPALDARTVLKMGTVNAARVCGFGGEIGELKPGMKADMILVDLEEALDDFADRREQRAASTRERSKNRGGSSIQQASTPQASTPPVLDIAELFIHRVKGSHVDTVIIGGRVIMEDRRFLTLDPAAISREARAQASKPIGAQQKAFADLLQRVKPYYQSWYRGWEDLRLEPFYPMNSKV
jgi:cytosine/adenosine deaminase-related metal-dependent hydrolase